MPAPTVQLLAYRFPPGTRFEGQLVGALERLESGGALRVLDVLFLARDPADGELVAGGGKDGGSFVAPLLSFRLDPAQRRRATERTVRRYAAAGALDELGAALEPGAALAAVLVEHVWARALQDAVARTGGAEIAGGPELAGAFVHATALPELLPQLGAVLGGDQG